jgi:putative ABC transport system permease protein
VLVWQDLRARNVLDFPIAPGDFADMRRDTTQFAGLAAVQTFRQPLTGDDREPEQIRVGGVTTNFFQVLGARLEVGRDFVEADGTPPPRPPAPAPPGQPQGRNTAPAAAPPPQLPTIAILSHGFWTRRYGQDRSIVGKTIDLGGRTEVVGVLAPGFELLFPPNTSMERVPDAWVAVRADFDNGSRINVALRVIGRLKPGASIDAARGEMETLATDLRARFPIKKTADMHFRVEPMLGDLVADVQRGIDTLMGAVVFVLLIACANVANLQLVRASARARELAVRAALGSSRWRLVRQMLVESLLIATGGALLGLLLAAQGIELLVRLAPESLPRMDGVAIDGMVLTFTLVAAVAAAVVFGMAPALRMSRPDVMEVLKAGGRSLATGNRRIANLVVVAEVALSFVLLVGLGLMVRSFIALQRANPGYDTSGVLTFVANSRGRDADQRMAFLQQVRDRLRALPGVTGVTAGSCLPLDGCVALARWGTEAARADPSKFQQMMPYFVLPGFFETLRTPLVAGRTFTDADDVADSKLIVIDSRLAAKAFPHESAIGKRLLARVVGNEPDTYQVIGVVAHQRHATITADGREGAYLAQASVFAGAAGQWAVRTSGDPRQLVQAVRAQIAQIDPLVPVAEIQTFADLAAESKGPTTFALVLIGVFAGIAALLAAIGLYGVLSTIVRQRTTEIGVRMAFGAPRRSIFQIFIGHGLRLSAIGVVLGLAAALALTRVMTTMLVDVKPTDPATFAAIALLFVVIAAAASWLPARRAARVEPMAALRDE